MKKKMTNDRKSKFGKERISWIKSIVTAIKNVCRPEAKTEDDSLWVMFRTNEKTAMKLTKDIADTIELEYSRSDGENFLNAFNVLCHACTPDCINKIVQMMFKYPVYFSKTCGNHVIRWMTSLPFPEDKSFTVAVSPVKVEYLSEFNVRAQILAGAGPYISARFTTTRDNENTELPISTTGLFEIYTNADTFFDGEWDLPGIFKYSIATTINYSANTKTGSNAELIMEIIRRCASDIIFNTTLWEGYFGEDRPETKKNSKPYYPATVGYRYAMFLDDIGDMTKTKRSVETVTTAEYSASLLYSDFTNKNTGKIMVDESNFEIKGDLENSEAQKDGAFVITIYPPLEERPKKPVVKTVANIQRDDDDTIEDAGDIDVVDLDEPDINVGGGYEK